MGTTTSVSREARRVGRIWRRSSRSIPDNQCVEVRRDPEAVAVRDSKGCHAVTLEFSGASWDSFLARWHHRE